MRKFIRFPAVATAAAAAALLAGCANGDLFGAAPSPTRTAAAPAVYQAAAPAVYTTDPVVTYPVAGVEYGRVTNIEFLPAGSPMASDSRVLGVVIGGLGGAALGNQIGSGTGRTAATILGAGAGAAIGGQLARDSMGPTAAPGYRITMETDQGIIRTYEVPARGNLRIGDRVRVDNGTIYM